jgi:uncharacterized repeat protein (TIGR01451 family)
VLAAQDGTTVTVNGEPQESIDRGEFLEGILTDPSQITADKPVLVMQYSNGTSYDGVTSDPFQMMIPPYEQFLSSYTVSTPPDGFEVNYVNVVAPNAAVGSVQLDGAAIPADSFTRIGDSGFSGVQVSIAKGSHRLTAPLPFGVHTYGFADADSYGYPGGLSTSEVARVASLTLSPKSQTVQVNTQQCVTATVEDQNGGPVKDIRVDYSVSGANAAQGSATTGDDGHAALCYTGTKTGDDTLTASVGTLSDTATVTWSTQGPAKSSPPKADVQLSVAGPAYVRTGRQATFAATVSNSGPDAATGVSLHASSPAGATFVSASGGNGCTGTVCQIGTLSSGASKVITLVYTANQTGTLNVAPSVESDFDPNTGNNSVSVATAVIAADAPPPPPPPPSQPGTFNAIGTGTVTINGTQVPADQLVLIKSGDQVDVTNGSLTMTTFDKSFGTFSSSQLSARRRTASSARAAADLPAAFVVSQAAAGGVTTLTLAGASFTGCGTPRSLSAKNQTPIRQLWGSGKGNFTTKGRFSAATVRGTVWLVQDRCDGTLTQVVQGVVDVLDTTKNTTVSVAAGKSYVALAPNGVFKPPAARLQTTAQVKLHGLRWSGRTFLTRAAFTRFLRAHGSTWTQFAKNYPQLAAGLASRK